MTKRLSNEVPNEYPVCNHIDCPFSEDCLHQVAYHEVMKRDTYIRLINPEQCSKDKDCKFFLSSKPVIYARGFKNMQKQMYPDQYNKFTNILMGHFGRNPYYERRKGENAMSPKEQKVVLDALRKVGVEKELKFDHYEESINWYGQ